MSRADNVPFAPIHSPGVSRPTALGAPGRTVQFTGVRTTRGALADPNATDPNGSGAPGRGGPRSRRLMRYSPRGCRPRPWWCLDDHAELQPRHQCPHGRKGGRIGSQDDGELAGRGRGRAGVHPRLHLIQLGGDPPVTTTGISPPTTLPRSPRSASSRRWTASSCQLSDDSSLRGARLHRQPIHWLLCWVRHSPESYVGFTWSQIIAWVAYRKISDGTK